MKLRLLILFLVSYQAFSQQAILNNNEYAAKYKKGVQLYKDQKYFEAQDIFTPLTLQKYNNSLSPYVHYYNALTSLKLKKYANARLMVRQLLERYPDWKQREEAYYVNADAYFAENYFDDALDFSDRITNADLKKEVKNLQYHYLKSVKDLAVLKQLNLKRPSNVAVAQQIVDIIQTNKRPTREDLELSDRLTNRFNFKIIKNPTASANDFQKDNINVAVLLPFRLANFDPSQRTRSNQYVYDFYEGMKIAKEKLATERIKLNLFAFDIDKNADDMINLVNNTNFGKMDMIIGPLFPEVNQVATAFTYSKNIVQIHPLSNNSQLVAGEPFTFLAMPSYEVQAKKAIEFMLIANPLKVVAIYYGNSKKDSTFAYIYRDQAIERGLQVSAIKHYTSDTDIETVRRAGHVFISGSDNAIGAKIISALDRKKVAVPVVASSAAFQFETASLTTFNRELYLIQPDYIDLSKDEVAEFRRSYIDEQNMIPSYYAYWGYDVALFFSRMLTAGNRSFRTQLSGIPYKEGYTLAGFDYTNNVNENQLVPIVRYQDGKFLEVAR